MIAFFFLVLCYLQGSGEQAVGMKHFQEALKVVRPSCLRSSLGRTELSPVSWEQIGGLDEVKLKLRQVTVQQCLNYSNVNHKESSSERVYRSRLIQEKNTS